MKDRILFLLVSVVLVMALLVGIGRCNLAQIEYQIHSLDTPLPTADLLP